MDELAKIAKYFKVNDTKAKMVAGLEQETREVLAQPPYRPCRTVLGLPKFGWAIICDVLAMALVMLCIPLLLTCSRRRPPGASLFDCSCGGNPLPGELGTSGKAQAAP